MINRLKGWISSRYVTRLLLYFAVIGLVPIIVFSMVTHNITYKSVQQQLALQTENTVMGVSASLEKTLNEYSEILRRLSEEEVIVKFVSNKTQTNGTLSMEALLYLYDEVSGKTHDLAAHVVSTQGKHNLSTDTVPTNYLPPFNMDWGIFRMAEQSMSAVLRTYDRNPSALPNVAFSMATAIRGAEGEIVGYVVFDIYHTMLEELLKEADLSYDLDIYIADTHHFLIHSTTAEIPRMLPKEMYSVVDIQQEGQSIRWQQQREAIYAGNLLPAYGRYVHGSGQSVQPVCPERGIACGCSCPCALCPVGSTCLEGSVQAHSSAD